MLQFCIKQIQTNIKKVNVTCFVNKIEIETIFFIFNTNPRCPQFLLYANLGVLLYGEVSMMRMAMYFLMNYSVSNENILGKIF